MSDLSRHLPLSNRERVDETAVTGDWRSELAEVVLLAEGLSPAPEARARFLAEAGLDGSDAASLTALAESIRSGRRRRIRALTDATRALLRLAGARPVALDPTTSGAVVLYATTRMAFDRRAALAGASLRAEDHGWTVGRGATRSAPARDILAFVLGLSDRVPGTPPRAER